MTLPEPSLGLLVIAARHAIRQAISSKARAHRLTTQQFWGVYSLRRLPGLAPGELAQWLLLDAPAASRLVADLSARKLVEARPDREDRRRARLYLTQKGDELANRLAVVADAYVGRMTAGLSDEEIRVIRAGLQKIVTNLEGFGEDERAVDDSPRRATPKKKTA